jgi:hypothetical protein
MKKPTKPAPDSTFSDIESLVRRAKLQRTAYIADVIATGLVAAANGVSRGFDAVAKAWRPKRRLAAR